MGVLASENRVLDKTILQKTDKIIENTCESYYNNKKKLISNLKKDKKTLSMTINSFLLKEKIYGLTDTEMDIFFVIKALK